LIFLGDVSQSMIDKTQNQPTFCNNIKNTNKKVFATFGNAYKNRSLEGCAFTLALASYPSNDNICNTNNVRITESNYITKGLDLNSVNEVYTAAKDVKINYGSSTASAHCDPSAADVPTGLYSVVTVSNRGTFWGLDTPSAFKDTGWTLFERAVLLTTGDNVWNVTFFTIPGKITAGKAFMLFAKVKSLAKPITEGSVAVTLDESPLGDLNYVNETGYWENRALAIQTDGYLKVSATDGSAEQLVRAGDLDVRILSGSYMPGKPYSMKANVLFQNNPTTADVKYRVWDSGLAVLYEGTMKYLGGTYYADLNPSSADDLILEVTAGNDTLSGGSFKIIRPQNATGISYTITPAEWVMTATTPGSETMTFTIAAGNELTGLSVEKSGELANYVTLNTSATAENVAVGKSTTFSAKLDWSGLKEGERRGEIFINSDQFSASVPIKLAYFKLTGDWMEAEPKVAKVSAPAGKTATYKIRLVNTANLPMSGIKVMASGGLTGMVSFVAPPYYINASSSKEVELLFDTKNKEQGTYTGVITFTSALGRAEVDTTFEVTPDISELLDTLQTDWDNELARLTEGGAQLSPTAAQLSQSINTTVEDARAALAQGDYTRANSLYRSAAASLEDLKKERKQADWGWLTYLVILAVLAGGGWFGWNYWKKKKAEKKKKPELPKAEESYRTEYY
ncbi:MAG: hypothetical protein QXD77_02780, partial [Candidatus Aenigmatarchaeota archaeon]